MVQGEEFFGLGQGSRFRTSRRREGFEFNQAVAHVRLDFDEVEPMVKCTWAATRSGLPA